MTVSIPISRQRRVGVTKVDDRLITDGSSLIAAIRSYSPGDKVEVTFMDSSGNSKTVTVTLAEATAGS